MLAISIMSGKRRNEDDRTESLECRMRSDSEQSFDERNTARRAREAANCNVQMRGKINSLVQK